MLHSSVEFCAVGCDEGKNKEDLCEANYLKAAMDAHKHFKLCGIFEVTSAY